MNAVRETTTELDRKSAEAERKAVFFASMLQSKYGRFVDKKIRNDNQLLGFWSDQIMLLNIYQASAPKMLAEASREIPASSRLKTS